MKRLHEFKIRLVDYNEDEALNKDTGVMARCTIDLFEVDSYREQVNDDNEKLELLTINLRSGIAFTIFDCSYDKFKKMMESASLVIESKLS